MSNEGLRIRIAELADTRWNTLNEYRRIGTMFPELFDVLNRILSFVETCDEGTGSVGDAIIGIMTEELKPRPAVLTPEADDVKSEPENASRPTRFLDRDRKIWWYEPRNAMWWNEEPFSPGMTLDHLRETRGPLIELKDGETAQDILKVNGEPWPAKP